MGVYSAKKERRKNKQEFNFSKVCIQGSEKVNSSIIKCRIAHYAVMKSSFSTNNRRKIVPLVYFWTNILGQAIISLYSLNSTHSLDLDDFGFA